MAVARYTAHRGSANRVDSEHLTMHVFARRQHAHAPNRTLSVAPFALSQEN
jgi:hypothetical protein